MQSINEACAGADKIVVGAGAGLTASAGIDYYDRTYFTDRYGPFLKTGCRTISEAVSLYWNLTIENAASFWGFWAGHINTVYHNQRQLETYKLLYELIEAYNCFIITTNNDGQFFKGLYDPEKVFAVHGNYGKNQCRHGCHPSVYDNQDLIKNMLEGFEKETLRVKESEVPFCPECGKLMSPNLRVDQYFIDAPYQNSRKAYGDFISLANEKILFLELGVGYNSPAIIREPFEEMTRLYKNAVLLRVNSGLRGESEKSGFRTFNYDADIHTFLQKIW